ncbi:hypothetical protein BGHDH14_bgh00180 [Blumeria hordei DH14]|uniref:Kynurenine formamidase n=1 Tax=Blumeria graminis f. sp. hordei (strain DH14) TaxID=546991 RepID=N1JQJ7_BLUG1|nr:hypothetical protein BGHDH14_bgh00180 [Blumeria hordei DH14]
MKPELNSQSVSPVITVEKLAYGDHELQRVAVYSVTPNEAEHDAIWLVYIHGGAWRDPEITEDSFLPTIKRLLIHPLRRHIKGFASISYRLSPHPTHPQEAATPANKYRNAQHPDHINDVLAGLTLLQNQYQFGHDYLLAGHSCGATLAFQSVMRDCFPSSTPKPSIIVGIAGIYNLLGLRDRHDDAAYGAFLNGAFGADESILHAAAPTNYPAFPNSWPEAKLVVLAQSRDDELVEAVQLNDITTSSLAQSNARIEVNKEIIIGAHDAAWQEGQIADLIVEKVLKSYFAS